jgi:hypothetical protein
MITSTWLLLWLCHDYCYDFTSMVIARLYGSHRKNNRVSTPIIGEKYHHHHHHSIIFCATSLYRLLLTSVPYDLTSPVYRVVMKCRCCMTHVEYEICFSQSTYLDNTIGCGNSTSCSRMRDLYMSAQLMRFFTFCIQRVLTIIIARTAMRLFCFNGYKMLPRSEVVNKLITLDFCWTSRYVRCI